jgi:hypothetical protein
VDIFTSRGNHPRGTYTLVGFRETGLICPLEPLRMRTVMGPRGEILRILLVEIDA